MTIEKFEAGFGYIAICDYCDEELYIDQEIWNGVIHEMKEHGWKSRKINNNWKHICPECLIKEVKESDNA